MQLKAVPENPLEWLALRLNKVPLPLLHGQIFPVISRAVLVAADKGVFHELSSRASDVDKMAERLGMNSTALDQLLQVLASLGYLKEKSGIYTLTTMARKWVAESSPEDLSDLLVYNSRVVWRWMEHLGDYLHTGKGVDYHSVFGKEEWELYQRAMLAVGRIEAYEFAKNCPLPSNSSKMLDIGGAPGTHVKAMQLRYPSLTADILDLPEALEVRSGSSLSGLTYIACDVRSADLGKDRYDLVLMSSLAHHFSEEENRSIARKVAESLRPGGVFVINEFVKPEKSDEPGGLVGTSSNLFFGLTSTSGTWTVSQTREWQKAAGLAPMKLIGYPGIPGRFQICARKER